MTTIKLEFADGDYLRVNMLAQLGADALENGNYIETIDYLLEYLMIVQRNSFNDLKSLDAPCYFNLALSYSNILQFEKSVYYWTKFLECNQNDYSDYFENNDTALFDAYFERCKSYIELNRIKEAIADIDNAIKIEPSRADLYLNKGLCYIRLFNKQEAHKAFIKAKSLGNKYAESSLKFCLPSKEQIEGQAISAFSDLLEKNNNKIRIKELAEEIFYLIAYLKMRKKKIEIGPLPFLNETIVGVSINDLTESDIYNGITNIAKKMFENSWNDIEEILNFQFDIEDLGANREAINDNIHLYFKKMHKI
jgi:tetratricopeptide (TPR) repeat protein